MEGKGEKCDGKDEEGAVEESSSGMFCAMFPGTFCSISILAFLFGF